MAPLSAISVSTNVLRRCIAKLMSATEASRQDKASHAAERNLHAWSCYSIAHCKLGLRFVSLGTGDFGRCVTSHAWAMKNKTWTIWAHLGPHATGRAHQEGKTVSKFALFNKFPLLILIYPSKTLKTCMYFDVGSYSKLFDIICL